MNHLAKLDLVDFWPVCTETFELRFHDCLYSLAKFSQTLHDEALSNSIKY